MGWKLMIRISDVISTSAYFRMCSLCSFQITPYKKSDTSNENECHQCDADNPVCVVSDKGGHAKSPHQIKTGITECRDGIGKYHSKVPVKMAYPG